MIKTLAKDDCFSYYVNVSMRKKQIPFSLECYDEKVPASIIVDAINGIQSDPQKVLPYLAGDYCYRNQQKLKCLTIKNCDLIIIGSFSDLTIKAYQHKKEKWKFFEIRQLIKDTKHIDADFDRLDLPAIDEVIKNNLLIFNKFQEQNPNAKSLWINYPYVEGATNEWADRNDVVKNKVMFSRWQEMTEKTTNIFPQHGIFVLNTPSEIVQPRNKDELLWHYKDQVYDYAADEICKIMGLKVS